MEEWNETQNGSSKNSLYRSGTWKPLCWKMPIPFSSSNTQLYSQILYLLLDCGAGRKVAICSSHIVSASLSSSHSSPHPVWNISCGRQSSPISPTWVLPMGFISSLTAPSWVFFPRPQICQACQQTYSSTKFYIHEAIAPTRSMLWHEFSYFWAFPCSSMGSCKCSRWGTAASSWSSPEAAKVSLLQCLEHIFLLLSTDLGVFRALSLTYSHSLLSCNCPSEATLLPFSSLFSQQHCCCPKWAQLWPTAGPSGS